MIKRRTFIAPRWRPLPRPRCRAYDFGAQPAQKLFDTHAHFYTNEPEKYPFNATGARYGAERMIAKATAKPMTPKAVFAFWDKVGVEMGTGVQYNSTYGTDNSYLLDVCKEHPNRTMPVVILSPTDAQDAGHAAEVGEGKPPRRACASRARQRAGRVPVPVGCVEGHLGRRQ